MHFPLWGMPLLPSSTTLFFFLLYILDIRSFFFLVLISFSQFYSSFHTLYTPLLLSLLFLLFFLSSSILLGIGHTIHFLLISQERILVPDFCKSISPCLCILHSPYTLPPSPSLSILSLVGVRLWGVYSSSHNIPAPFPIQDLLAFFLAVPFVVWPYMPPLLLFNLNIWVFLFEMANPLTSEIFHFLHHLLPSHFYLFPYSILHYSTHYRFKFILGN